MKTIHILTVWCCLIPLSVTAYQPAGPYDLVVMGGRLLDGTGGRIYAADIGIRDGKIADVGYLQNTGRRTIDARGYWVTPGFIDMHSRWDHSFLEDGRGLSVIYQGITLVLLGDHALPGALPEKTVSPESGVIARTSPDRKTLRQYFESLKQKGFSLNVASYVSSGQVRESVLGFENRPPRTTELQKMKDLVSQAMRDGALGLNSPFSRAPNSFAGVKELIALAEVARAGGGIYSCAPRARGADPLSGLRECLQIAQAAKIGIEIEHIDPTAGALFGDYIDMIDLARKMGVDIEASICPCASQQNFIGMIRLPWVTFGGDSGALRSGNGSLAKSQPLLSETFPGLIGLYARVQGVLPPEEMVYRMTWKAAKRLNLKDRGKIAPGMAADLAVFKPETISDPATYSNFAQHPRGIQWLLVNGTPVVDNGEFTGATPGVIVRGPGWKR